MAARPLVTMMRRLRCAMSCFVLGLTGSQAQVDQPRTGPLGKGVAVPAIEVAGAVEDAYSRTTSTSRVMGPAPARLEWFLKGWGLILNLTTCLRSRAVS